MITITLSKRQQWLNMWDAIGLFYSMDHAFRRVWIRTPGAVAYTLGI